jgi:uncharacterized protein YndB with AHSA1/START domain
VTDPIEVNVRVQCEPGHAFAIWTERIDLWWPRAHSVTKDPDLRVSIEPRVGGRIVERSPAGDEHAWGEILTWDPPRRLAYLWHIYGARGEATRVEVTFAGDAGATVVTIVHTGWEQLATTRPDLRERNEIAWSRVLPHFAQACGPPDERSGS